MKVGRLDIEGDAPATITAERHGREQDLRPPVPHHAAQITRALTHRELAELRKPNRARSASSDTNVRAFVPQAKRSASGRLLLEARKPRRLPSTLAAASLAECSERSTQVDGRFFEDLRADLGSPSQSNASLFVRPGFGADLPCIEAVDQIEPRPRHLRRRVGLLRNERGLDDAKALIEREACGTDMTAQRFDLRSRRLEREAERRVPHPSHLVTTMSVAAIATNPRKEGVVFS